MEQKAGLRPFLVAFALLMMPLSVFSENTAYRVLEGQSSKNYTIFLIGRDYPNQINDPELRAEYLTLTAAISNATENCTNNIGGKVLKDSLCIKSISNDEKYISDEAIGQEIYMSKAKINIICEVEKAKVSSLTWFKASFEKPLLSECLPDPRQDRLRIVIEEFAQEKIDPR